MATLTRLPSGCRWVQVRRNRLYASETFPRHEATSRLFENGLSVEQVALVTGHRDWKMLKRYTNLRPERLQMAVAAAAVNG